MSRKIVKSNIPLLLSKKSVKRSSAVIDMQNDIAIIFNTESEILLPTSGHYCIEIFPDEQHNYAKKTGI